MTHSDPKWDNRSADTDLYDLIRMEYEEVALQEGGIGIPEEVLCPPVGFIPGRRKGRPGYPRPKKFIPVDLSEIK